MSNVLGNLFQDIADAIRTKNGDIASMKPNEFAEKILALSVGSGDGEGGNTGGTIGEMKFASGSFSNNWSELLSVFSWTETTRYGFSYTATDSESGFVPEDGETYMCQWHGVTYLEKATSYATFAGYSNCIVMGNKSAVTGAALDESGPFLLIHLNSGANIIYSVEVANVPTPAPQLRIYSPQSVWSTKRIEHGMEKMPDFIMVYSSFNHANVISAVWGFRSEFSDLIGNKLSGLVASGFGSSKSTGLDNSPRGRGYIYCPNDEVFVVGNSMERNVATLGGNDYFWFALSGLGGAINIVDANLQTKTITENGTYLPDDGYNGFSKVTVAMPTEEPVLGELTITENGTYIPGDGLDGYSKVTVNVEGASSVTEVFPETELPFVLNPDYGMYLWSATPATFSLAEGKEYVVVWDGTAYTCTAKSAVFITSAGVGVGNFAMAGIGDNTGEPFLLGVTADGSAVLCFTTETDESHTVRIYQKASAGGGVEVCYVTFMSHDGVTELYKKAVIPGDNCMNPVEMGWLNAPAKNPTNTEVFTFDGWSATAGGSADASVLDKVNADKTVYAAYTASTRYYTVRFFDGDTLLNTMQVPYGGTAEYTAEKDGMNFGGWNPSNANITADTDCYAVWQEALTFANGTFEKINEICEAGEAANYFAVGDEKTITGTDGESYVLRIIGVNFDDKYDGSGKAGITVAVTKPNNVFVNDAIAFHEPYDTTYNSEHWVSPGTYIDKMCFMRYWLTKTFKPLLPTDLQGVIKTVSKTTEYWNGAAESKTYKDTIFAPSTIELGTDTQSQVSAETLGCYPGFNSLAKRTHYDSSGANNKWWTRCRTNSKAYYVGEYGNVDNQRTSNMDTLYGVVPCFCI